MATHLFTKADRGRFMLFINGEWVPARSGATFTSTNPATGESLGEVADAGRADARAAVDAATQAFAGWKATTAHERSAYLYEAWRALTERKEDLARLMTQEQGKPLRMARNEVGYAADFLLWFAEEAKRVYGTTIASARADRRFMTMFQPVGVTAAITPWNYPISMLTRKIAPALAAGCTVVIKPAEQTPLCAIETIRTLESAGLPAGVVNLLPASEPAPIGDELLSNPNVRKLTFTGSTEVGKHLAKRAADQLKRVSLELGGHAPFLVFEDADAVHAARGATLVKLLNTGQACICPNRLFVHESIADRFVSALCERVGKLQPGNGLDPAVGVGPLIDEPAMRKMETQVADATGRGASLKLGGHRLVDEPWSQGYFYAPTVLADVTPDMRIYREETFGPIAPVITFRDEADAVAMANDTTYGLAAYLYTNKVGRAFWVMEQLDFGIIGINDINPTSASVPFGGIKQSGVGREGAHEGLLEYLDQKPVGIAI
jgi:succinate-semialdehyde dehydrogenase/glutarate-semialdehyde dehydrogenase